MKLDQIKANDMAGIAFAEVLVACGVRQVVISPGSRSTPLTIPFALHAGLESAVVLDERSAAFFALGQAKASGQPVVLLCTSGTAAANYLPAVVEASLSATPLLVLTADRPDFLQQSQSGQTIQQRGLYASFTRWEHNLALPETDTRYLRYLRETIKHALMRSCTPFPGPVHLNVPFDEPLAPELDPALSQSCANSLRALLHLDAQSFNGAPSRMPLGCPVIVTEAPEGNLHGQPPAHLKVLILVGPDCSALESELYGGIFHFSTVFNAPVLADATNSVRNHPDLRDRSILNYEILLRSDEKVDALRPDLIIQVGDLPTSKALRSALERWDSPLHSISLQPDRCDPSFSNSVQALPEIGTAGNADYLERWTRLDRKLNEVKTQLTSEMDGWAESLLCGALPALIPEASDLFVANSMIIREMELFWSGTSKVKRVFTNRGASGIDGELSTALGAAVSDRPLICLIGDLAFLHDASGLGLVQHLKGTGKRVLFILLDNGGGGIFEYLPVSQIEPPFETHFATPQRTDFEALCRAYGVTYQAVDGCSDVRVELEAFFASQKEEIKCLHLRFDRKVSFQIRKAIVEKMNFANVET